MRSRNEALIQILREIYDPYNFKSISTPINMHNTWHSAMDFAEDIYNNNSKLFSVAYVLDWIKRNDPENFDVFRNRILATLSDKDKNRFKTYLYEFDIRNIESSHLTVKQLTDIEDTNEVGSGDVIVDFLRQHLWAPQDVILDHSVAKMLCDAIPTYIATVDKYHVINPDDIFPSWHDPFHPKVNIAPGYVEERKKSAMSNIFKCFRNSAFAVEAFDRAYNDQKYDKKTNKLWQELIKKIPDYMISQEDKDKYCDIAQEKAAAEHEFMEQSAIFSLTGKGPEECQENLKEILQLARTIYNTRHGADDHIEYVITLLKSTMTQGLQYIIDGKNAADIKSDDLRAQLTLPSPSGDKEFADFLASIKVKPAEPSSKPRKFGL